jgi:hypothetical protein
MSVTDDPDDAVTSTTEPEPVTLPLDEVPPSPPPAKRGRPRKTTAPGLAADPAPKPRAKRRRRTTPRETPAKAIENEIAAQLLMLAKIWQIKDPICGGALETQAGEIAAWAGSQAERSPGFARACRALTSSGGWLGGVTASAPVLVAVYMHHVQPRLDQARLTAAQAQWEAAVESGQIDPNVVPAPNGQGPVFAPDTAQMAGTDLRADGSRTE